VPKDERFVAVVDGKCEVNGASEFIWVKMGNSLPKFAIADWPNPSMSTKHSRWPALESRLSGFDAVDSPNEAKMEFESPARLLFEFI